MKAKENMLTRLIKQSWFFSAFVFLGLIISGKVHSIKDFFSILTLCLVFWLLDSLFLKKSTTLFLTKVMHSYKRFFYGSGKE